MVILGHPLISHETIYTIQYTSQIIKAPKNSILLFEYNEKLIALCKEKEVKFALHVKDEKEAILANAFGAFIIVCDEDLAIKVQNLAEYYLFDSKVALIINSINALGSALEKRVDMVILQDAIYPMLP